VIRNAGCFSASNFFNIRLVQVTLKKDRWSIVFLFCSLPKALDKLFSTEVRLRALVGQRKKCTNPDAPSGAPPTMKRDYT
jgi:hypothetical protein